MATTYNQEVNGMDIVTSFIYKGFMRIITCPYFVMAGLVVSSISAAQYVTNSLVGQEVIASLEDIAGCLDNKFT